MIDEQLAFRALVRAADQLGLRPTQALPAVPAVVRAMQLARPLPVHLRSDEQLVRACARIAVEALKGG